MAFEAVVAAAVDTEMSVEAIGDRIEPVSEKSKPVTWKVFEPAEETVAVVVVEPISAVASPPTTRSSNCVSLIR
jgi:hypothetical protein